MKRCIHVSRLLSQYGEGFRLNLFFRVGSARTTATGGIDKKHLHNQIAKFVECPNKQLRDLVCANMHLYPNFITEKEETSLMSELEPYLRKLRYERDHWDSAIRNYRETERQNWRAENQIVIDRLRSTAMRSNKESLLHAHILDLHEAGVINAHVDAVRFCGDTIATVSLLSDCVMLLSLQEDSAQVQMSNSRNAEQQRNRSTSQNRNKLTERQTVEYVRVHVPRYSLYIMYDDVRYRFAHEVVGNDSPLASVCGLRIRKSRRVAVILRSLPSAQYIEATDAASYSTYGVLEDDADTDKNR